jgi:hypothetical protein
MTDQAERKYQSGSEVLEKFIPGYHPAKTPDDEPIEERKSPASADQLRDALLADLKTKLDQLQIAEQQN